MARLHQPGRAAEHRPSREDAGEAPGARAHPGLRELGGLRHREQDDPHREGRLGLHRAHHRGLGEPGSQGEAAPARPEAEGRAGSKGARSLGHRLLRRAGEGGALPLRRPEGPAVLRGEPGVPGRARRLRKAVRRLLPPGGERRGWHPDVRTYDVIAGPSFGDGAGKSLGRVYLDIHPREGKYKHAAQFTVITGRGRRLPEGVLLCNFPQAGRAGLMEHGEVRTLFHEFGHLLHHILGGHTRWAGKLGRARPSRTSSRRPRRCSRSGCGIRACCRPSRRT